MNEQLKALFEGMELSNEFREKIQEAFESAVADAVDKETAQIEEATEEKYAKLSKEYADYVVAESEEVVKERVETEILPMVEKYMDYSVKQFMTENKLEIESGIKVELAESFLSGMTGLVESFNVKVPEGRDDYVMQMEQKAADMQKRFEDVLDEKNDLEEQIVEGKRDSILSAKLKDLTESQKEKISAVAERVKFNDEEQFGSAVEELVESYFPASDLSDHKESLSETKEESIDETKGSKKSWSDSLFDSL